MSLHCKEKKRLQTGVTCAENIVLTNYRQLKSLSLLCFIEKQSFGCTTQVAAMLFFELYDFTRGHPHVTHSYDTHRAVYENSQTMY